MKIQKKLLTDEQKAIICKTHVCYNCPLRLKIKNISFSSSCCYQNIVSIEKDIKNFWNEEVEVEI